MMENTSKKQIILSIVGVAILVIAIIGSSFAFFFYTRTGSSNNTISTGAIVFNFKDGDTISLNNHFPITITQGQALSGNGNVCTFTISGYSSSSAITYDITAVEGDAMDGKTRFDDSDVFIQITSANVEGITFTPVEDYDNGKAIGALPLKLGSGSVTTTVEKSKTFEVRMWVDSSVVIVTDTPEDGETRKVYATDTYGNLYYSMKIKVEANA